MDRFVTDRLLLRRFTPDDWQDLYSYLSIEEVTRFLPEFDCSEQSCKVIVRERSENEHYWVVCLRGCGEMIGHIHLHPVYDKRFAIYEIGYVFNPRYWGKGYATEACQKLLAYGFGPCRAHRIIATCDPENERSWRLMERLGMRREAHFIRCLFLRSNADGTPVEWRDEYHYALLASEFQIPASEEEGTVIRYALPEDIQAMADIYARSWKAAYHDILPDDFLNGLTGGYWEESYRKSLGKPDSPRVSVMLVNGQPVGVSSFGQARDAELGKEWGEIISIYLLPQYWSRGLGAAFLSWIQNELISMGYTHCALWTLLENERAQKAYEREGFTSDRHPRFITIADCDLPEIRYIKDLINV